jgi:ribosomal protein L11 methyltransferase
MNLVLVRIEKNLNTNDILAVDKMAFADFECEGKHEYSMVEEEVDRVLGKEAFCGGELDEKYYDLIEKEMLESTPASYYWSQDNRELALMFSKKLVEDGYSNKIEEVENEDWNEKWRDSFKQIIVSPDMSVIPSWEKTELSDKDLYIYPGLGFGTGNHETTYLCLKLYLEIENKLKRQIDCLDFGCGSGILGIAPLKRLDASVTFVDIDVEALDNCVINLEINNHLNYNGKQSVVLRDRYSHADIKYELVFANILENVLEEEKEPLLLSGKSGGYLIVSGLLNDQVENIKKVYNELMFVKTESKGDWSAILFKYR